MDGTHAAAARATTLGDCQSARQGHLHMSCNGIAVGCTPKQGACRSRGFLWPAMPQKNGCTQNTLMHMDQ